MKLKHVVVAAVAVLAVGRCAGDPGDPGDAGGAQGRDRPVAGPAAAPGGREAPSRPRSRQRRPRSPAPAADVGTALAALALLPVKGRAPMTGYDRARFGPAWLDADRNGCDTRNDVLGQRLRSVVLEDNGCVVASGAYDDPYTGSRIDYRQGNGFLIDIDHVVSLGNAWATGAFRWSVLRRAALANDPLNLLPADAGANRQKGDADAATWLPPHKPFRCAYVARQVAVKAKYGLWVTPPEGSAVERVLASCPARPLPADRWGAPTVVDQQLHDPGDPAPAAPAPGRPRTSGGVATPYENCDAARAAGAAPVRRGDPGYGPHLDGDGDGAACE